MLFRDKLDEIRLALDMEFENLFQKALANQAHSGDLLLIVINGFFDEEIGRAPISEGSNLSPYLIGPSYSGHADNTHYNFIHQYRTKIAEWTYPEYLKLHEYSPEREEEINHLLEKEYLSIHLESLIYLKIWEGDHFIKTWFQFVQVLQGKPYDWHFKIISNNKEKGTGKRQDLIRTEIRDKIKIFSEPIYKTMKRAYLTQIRNSIAHSNFSFQGRNFHLNNYVKNDKSHQLKYLEFDDWVEMFHSTIMLHNFYIRLKNKINRFYGEKYLKDKNGVEIRICKADGNTQYKLLEFRQEFEDWKFKY